MLNNWILSTDIGCDFIFLDGVIHAYELSGDERLPAIIEEMISVYLSIDLEAILAQTHSTLTGIRALLRYYALTGKEELLSAAVERFELYKSAGMTENYENYNWFGRPTHTEPCAIHDSHMVAKQLWQFTGSKFYLEDAEHIYYNGIGATQRSNGGFGCNSCAGAGDYFLGMKIYEAHWCCTMRGSEGLSYAARTSMYTKGETLYITAYGNKRTKIHDEKGSFILEQVTGYPFEGKVLLEVKESSMSYSPQLRIFSPGYLKNFSVILNGKLQEAVYADGFISLPEVKTGDRIEFGFDFIYNRAAAMNPNSLEGSHTFRAGPLVLTSENLNSEQPMAIGENPDMEYVGEGKYLVDGHTFISAYHLMDPGMDVPLISRQIVF